MKKQRLSTTALFMAFLIVMLPIVEAQSLQGPTGDTSPPSITNVQLTHGPTTLVTWATDEASNSKIDFGIGELNLTATKPDLETAHSLTISTTAGETYQYKITSCDAANNCKSTSLETFVAGPFYVKADIPRYARSTKLDIPGSTRPGATVAVTVNGAEVRKDQIDDGIFLFKNIQLLKQINTINLKATLGTDAAEANYQVDVDDQPPIINVTVEPVVTKPTVTAKVKVSEPVNLTIELSKATGDKPLRPTELEETGKSASHAELKWKPVTGIQEYGVYRDGKRIAILPPASSSYKDAALGAGKTYKYQVSTIDNKCIESDLSDILTITTDAGTNTESTLPEKTFTCDKPPIKQAVQAGETNINIPLKEGENIITFTAEDKAGYKSIAEERVLYDTGPPKFEKTNLAMLSPTYTQQITIKGKLNEKGAVTAFVNGKPKETKATESDGNFEIRVNLERSVNYTSGQERTQLDTGIGWKNKVKLEAVDAAGLKASTEEVSIDYQLCGSGTWIDVKLTDPMPTILNPRLLMEGIQQVGIGFTYEYKGGQEATINPGEIRIKKLNLAPEFQKEYDNGLVTVSKPPIRAQRGKKPSGQGYIQINFLAIEDPWSLPETDKKDEKAPANATTYSKEERISQHREGTCLAPGFGCMRLFLELEIPFQEKTQILGYDPKVTGVQEGFKPENRIQRTCVNVEVAIDKRIPPKYIPSGLLKTISDVLTKIIDTIDQIIKPIETIGKYLFYTCVAGTFLSFIPIFLEKYNCEYKTIESAVAGGDGKFDAKVAEIGQCDAEYQGKDQSKQNCNTCATWKDNRRKFERTYRQICDRVMCPAAPSLQYYLKTKGRQKTGEVSAPTALQQVPEGYKTTGKLLAGSDCAAWMQEKQKTKQLEADDAAKTSGRPALRVPPSKYFTNTEIQEIYQNWLKHKDDKSSDTAKGKVNCAGLHPASQECCGFEYMQEWSSACGVSALGQGLDTFDEIKESACLSAQKANLNEIKGLKGETTQCSGPGNLLNAISGFCDKNGQPAPETIRVVPFAGAVGDPNSKLSQLGLEHSREKYLYLLMIPDNKGKQEYNIKLGYVVEKLEFERSNQTVSEGQEHEINAKLSGIELQETGDVKEFFTQEKIDAYYQGKTTQDEYNRFQEYLCINAGYATKDCGANGRDVYNQVMGKLGTPDKEYIIRPNDGLINSIRCLCFPTILGYLKLWRKILGAVRNCINTILLTGDGDTGVCQSIISVYICDLLYEVLACFTQKFSGGGVSARTEGVANIVSALNSAGTEMSRSVESRYGDSGMYKAVFVERKLVHSICMWAFTGTWNFDLGTVYDQSVDTIPLESQALLKPCSRRFIAFNPATKPGGLVTWVYNFGVFVAAGADIDLEMHLVCSGGFKCRESDGFENGKCDCTAPKDIVISPAEIPTRVKKNELLNQEVFFTMQGAPGDSQIRYDKAYLKWSYKDGNKVVQGQTDPCTIGLTGGTPTVPPFCKFEILTQSFRCQFGEAEGALRFVKGETIAPHNIPAPTFAVNDEFNATLQIQQEYTGQEQTTKHLQFEVLTPSGQVVETNKETGFIPLQTPGDYQLKIGPVNSVFPIKAKEQWFGAGEVGKKFSAKQWSSTKNPEITTENTMISDMRYFTPGGDEYGQTQGFVLELSNTAGSMQYNLYTASTSTAMDKIVGFTAKQTSACTGPVTGDNIVCSPTPAPNVSPPFQGTVRITLTANRPDPGEKRQAHIIYSPEQGTNPCAPANRLKPQMFKIRFMAFDSDKYGQPTEQVTLDPITGQEAILEVPFNVICAKNDEPALIQLKEKQAGIMQPLEILQGLEQLMRDMKEKEEKDKMMVEGTFIKKSIGDSSSIKTVDGFMDTIITNEQKFSNDLQKFIKGLTDLKAKTPELEELKTKLEKVYNRIRPPLPQEITEAETSTRENIIYQSNAVKKQILDQTGPGKTPNYTELEKSVQQTLREMVKSYEKALADKKAVIDYLATVVKKPSGPCPTGTEDPITKMYYLCSATPLPEKTPDNSAAWKKEADRPCYGLETQTCYSISSATLCPAETKEDPTGTTYKCATAMPEGFTLELKNRQCLTAGQKCYSKPLAPSEKYARILKVIQDMIKTENTLISNHLNKYLTMTPANIIANRNQIPIDLATIESTERAQLGLLQNTVAGLNLDDHPALSYLIKDLGYIISMKFAEYTKSAQVFDSVQTSLKLINNAKLYLEILTGDKYEAQIEIGGKIGANVPFSIYINGKKADAEIFMTSPANTPFVKPKEKVIITADIPTIGKKITEAKLEFNPSPSSDVILTSYAPIDIMKNIVVTGETGKLTYDMGAVSMSGSFTIKIMLEGGIWLWKMASYNVLCETANKDNKVFGCGNPFIGAQYNQNEIFDIEADYITGGIISIPEITPLICPEGSKIDNTRSCQDLSKACCSRELEVAEETTTASTLKPPTATFMINGKSAEVHSYPETDIYYIASIKGQPTGTKFRLYANEKPGGELYYDVTDKYDSDTGVLSGTIRGEYAGKTLKFNTDYYFEIGYGPNGNEKKTGPIKVHITDYARWPNVLPPSSTLQPLKSSRVIYGLDERMDFDAVVDKGLSGIDLCVMKTPTGPIVNCWHPETTDTYGIRSNQYNPSNGKVIISGTPRQLGLLKGETYYMAILYENFNYDPIIGTPPDPSRAPFIITNQITVPIS